mmetsp:Transcript_60132/g.196399  ORF Transcript_60132/g.196399 Transcript_60132/m.196399 type:complete len:245 (+) Transcript_60132:3300-4034(+)
MHRRRIAGPRQEVDHLWQYPEVANLAGDEETYFVKEPVHLCSWLVDSGNDGAFSGTSGQALQRLDDRLCHVRIQPCGGLIYEEQSRIREQLRGKAQSFTLIPGDVMSLLAMLVADDLRSDLVQTQLHHHSVHTLGTNCSAEVCAQTRLEQQVLPYFEFGEKFLILMHVGGARIEDIATAAHVQPVHFQRAFKRSITACKRIQQRGLARARRSHDREHLARECLTVDPIEDVLFRAVVLGANIDR